MSVKGRYLRDENNEIFSPITSSSSIVAGVNKYNNENIKLDYFYDSYVKYVNSDTISTVNFADLKFEKGCFYDFNIAGTITGDAGATGSVLIKPNIRITWS